MILRRGTDVKQPTIVGDVRPTALAKRSANGSAAAPATLWNCHNTPTRDVLPPGCWVFSRSGPTWISQAPSQEELRRGVSDQEMASRWQMAAVVLSSPRRALTMLAKSELNKRAREGALGSPSNRVPKKKKKAKARKDKQAKNKADARKMKTETPEHREGQEAKVAMGGEGDITPSPNGKSKLSHKEEGVVDQRELKEAQEPRGGTYEDEKKGEGEARERSANPNPTLNMDYSFLYGDTMEEDEGEKARGERRIVNISHSLTSVDKEASRVGVEMSEIEGHTCIHPLYVEALLTDYVDEDALLADEEWEVFLQEAQDMIDPSASCIWVDIK